MFNSIINNEITLINFMICVLTALILGFLVSIVHMKTSKSNSNFITTLVILPLIVSIIILLINGNLGTGIAIAGAFSLVRFRSIPANSREILSVFLAMSIGLAVGTGYIAFALIFTLICLITLVLLYKLNFGMDNNNDKTLKICIPEDLNYINAFDDIFNEYLEKYDLEKAKTINMGSMFELTYRVNIKDEQKEKELIDKIRVRNGNLKVLLVNSKVLDNEL